MAGPIRMTSAYLRLQEPIALSANKDQDIQFAMDCGQYNTVIVQFRRLGAAPTAGTLQMQHAALNTEGQYENIGTSMNLNTTGILTIAITTHSRFLRWSLTGLTGSVTFQVDIVARV